MFKKALSFFLCVMMLTPSYMGTGIIASANSKTSGEELSSVAVTESSSYVVPEVASYSYSGVCGDNLTWAVDNSARVLYITGTGDMYDYYFYNELGRTPPPWKGIFDHVVIGEGVTSIGDYAFYEYGIKSVSISSTVTEIGWFSFGYSSLTSVVIPDTVKSIETSAFEGCYFLTSASIGSSVECIREYAFNECTSLQNINILGNVATVYKNTFINTAYYNDESNWIDGVLYIDDHLIAAKSAISGAYTVKEGTKTIANFAFQSCTALTGITVADSVATIGIHAFSDCSKLADVNIPDSVTSIGTSAFAKTAYYNNSSNWVEDVLYAGRHLIASKSTVSGICNIKPGTLTVVDSAFYNRSSLTGVVIPDSLISVGERAFYQCSSLESVVFGNSVSKIGDFAFLHCTELKNIEIPDSVTSVGENAFNNTGYYQDDANWIDGVLYLGNHILKAKTSLSGVYFVKPGTLTISVSAFRNCAVLTEVVLPDSVVSIGDYAFYECSALTSVTIPRSVESIGFYTFRYYHSYGNEYCLDVTLRCYEDTYAHSYAVNHAMGYELICDHIFTVYTEDNNATCTEDGSKTAYCDNGCGTVDVIVIKGSALGHSWTDWITTVEPTYTEVGERLRYCLICKHSETEVIAVIPNPNKPVISVDNFTVTITNAEYIKDMRFVRGEYTTPAEIKNAEGNVALSSELIVKNTVDGCFIYEMPDGGIYSIWIRMKDGTNYVMPVPVTNVTPSVSSYGVKITLHDLFDVKDFFIAKGEYNSYSELKKDYIVRVTAVKIAGKHTYTYTVFEPGVHTVLVRCNDGTEYILHEELTVDEPVFTTNGLQLTVSNIPDVKVIRTAYGEYATPGDVKRAVGARNFSGKSVIKGVDEYMIQYRENGVVTIAVEYNNGYVKMYYYDVVAKQASCIHNGSTVIFGDLGDFVMIRYAMGEYTTSAQIKRAAGSKVTKAVDLTGEYAIISGLAKGTYTFCVQFDDESYNYFNVVVE